MRLVCRPRSGSALGSLNTLLAMLKLLIIVLIAFQTPFDVSKSRIPARLLCRSARLRRKFYYLAAVTLCLRFSKSFEFVHEPYSSTNRRIQQAAEGGRKWYHLGNPFDMRAGVHGLAICHQEPRLIRI